MDDNILISELLSCVYASHVAACEESGNAAVSADCFYKIYQNNIPEFRRLLGIVKPDDPCG